MPAKTRFDTHALRVLDVHPLKSAENRDNYRSILRRWILPTFADKYMQDIDTFDIDAWYARTRTKTSATNLRNIYSVMRVMFRYAVKWRVIKENPCQVENAWRQVEGDRPEHDLDEFARVRALLPADLADAATVAFAAHLRIGEVAGLNVSDWDRGTGVLTVRRQVRKDGLRPTKTGKVKKLRPLDIGTAVLNRVTAQSADPDAPMFWSPRAGRLRVQYLRDRWNRACAAAGVANYHFHDNRATGLTLVATAGATTRELMARGGHSTMNAALEYQKRSMTRDAEVARQADEILRQRLG